MEPVNLQNDYAFYGSGPLPKPDDIQMLNVSGHRLN
jgi:hypothetical protein